MLPPTLLAAAEAALAAAGEPLPLQSYEILKGGYSSRSVKIMSRRNAYLLKWHEDSAPDTYVHEAYSLHVLREAGVLRVPAVLAAGSATAETPGFLLQEWIPTRPWPIKLNRVLGARIAELHRCGNAAPGYAMLSRMYEVDPPPWTDWVTCYREHFLRPAIRRASERGLLTPELERDLERVLGRLDDVLGGVTRAPALIHGDLWRNNILCDTKGQPALIDARAAYADHEYELMIAEEYGGFGLSFFDAYESVWPTEPGRRERRDLYRLHQMLLRLDATFKSTLSEIAAVLRWYVGP